jgi:hypothetical protein
VVSGGVEGLVMGVGQKTSDVLGICEVMMSRHCPKTISWHLISFLQQHAGVTRYGRRDPGVGRLGVKAGVSAKASLDDEPD